MLLAICTAGCTSESLVSGDRSAQALRGVETKYGTLRMAASDGAPVHLRPGDTLTIKTHEGSVSAEAGKFCRNEGGIYLREDDQDCSQAARVATWDDIESVQIEQFDGGSTVTVVTAGAAVVALTMIALAATKGKTPSGGRSDTSTPAVAHRHATFMAFGFGSQMGRTPRYDVDDDRLPPYTGEPGTASNWQVSTGGATPAVTPAALPPPAHDSVPLFSGRARRRAVFRPSMRVDAGACAFSDACFTGSARVGATFLDILDISGGARWERGKTDTVLATVGAGLNGTFPRLPALSVYIGTQFGFGDGFRIVPSAGLRMKPGGNVSIGILPASFTYFSPDRTSPERSRVAYTPSLELGYEF